MKVSGSDRVVCDLKYLWSSLSKFVDELRKDGGAMLGYSNDGDR